MCAVGASSAVSEHGGVGWVPEGLFHKDNLCVAALPIWWFNGSDVKMVQRRGLGRLLSVCEPCVAFCHLQHLPQSAE